MRRHCFALLLPREVLRCWAATPFHPKSPEDCIVHVIPCLAEQHNAMGFKLVPPSSTTAILQRSGFLLLFCPPWNALVIITYAYNMNGEWEGGDS